MIAGYYDVSYLKVEVNTPRGEPASRNWIKIGRGFKQEDGSIDVKLDAVPLALSPDTRFRLFWHES